MNIAKVDFNPETASYEVYVTGCTLRCKGCHNPNLQAFTEGTPWREHMGVLADNHYVERVMVMGGEPLDQDRDELEALLTFLGEHFEDVWLFTGYSSPDYSLLPLVDHMKTGGYVEGCEGWTWNFGDGTSMHLASGNQLVWGGRRCMSKWTK